MMSVTRAVAAAAGLLASAALLSACAETELIVHSAKKLSKVWQDEDAPPPGPPVPAGYKLGEPYVVEGVRYFPHFDPSYDVTGIASWYGEPFHGRATANGERYDMNELTAAHKTMPLPSTVRVTNLENGRQVTLRVNDRGPFVGGRIIDISRRGAQLLGFYRKGTAKVRVEFVEFAPLNVVAKKDNATPRRRMDAAEMAAVPSEPVAVREEISSQYLDAPMAESAAGGTGGDRLASASATSAASAAEPANGTTLSGMFVQVGAFAERANAVRLARQLSSLAPSVIAAANVDGRTLYRVRLGPLADMAEADRLLARTVAAGHGDARVIVAR